MLIRVDPDSVGTLRILLEGELDLATVDKCEACLIGIVSTPSVRDLVIDLVRLTFLDCAGLRALVAAKSCARRAGVRVRVERPQPVVAVVLQASGTWDLLMAAETAADARAA